MHYDYQGFGSSCDGLGLPLTPYNGLRNFVMEKKMRLEKNCDFPSWLRQNSWQIIIQVRSSVFEPWSLFWNIQGGNYNKWKNNTQRDDVQQILFV